MTKNVVYKGASYTLRKNSDGVFRGKIGKVPVYLSHLSNGTWFCTVGEDVNFGEITSTDFAYAVESVHIEHAKPSVAVSRAINEWKRTCKHVQDYSQKMKGLHKEATSFLTKYGI